MFDKNVVGTSNQEIYFKIISQKNVQIRRSYDLHQTIYQKSPYTSLFQQLNKYFTTPFANNLKTFIYLALQICNR